LPSPSKSPSISDLQRKQVEEHHAVLEARYKHGTLSDFVKAQIEKSSTSPVLELGNARLYALLGDRTSALNELEKSVDGNGFGVVFVKADPFLDSIRNEPRYQSIPKRMNLPAN
jgi:hypothetical protein